MLLYSALPRQQPAQSSQVWSEGTWSNKPASEPSLRSGAGLLNQEETRMLIGPQTVKPRPCVISPKPPIGCLHHSQKKQKKQTTTERALSHWSPRPQTGKAIFILFCFFFPLPVIGQFSKHANCQSLSSGQSGFSTCRTFWNYEKKQIIKKGNKKNDDAQGDQPIR